MGHEVKLNSMTSVAWLICVLSVQFQEERSSLSLIKLCIKILGNPNYTILILHLISFKYLYVKILSRQSND